MTLLFPPTEPHNKFHDGNPTDGKHYWLTPPDLYARLDAEFHFDFDPCPYPLRDGFDGLTCEWGQSNYVNPPFGSIIHQGKVKGPTAWARKAIAEHRKGKTVVFVYPMHKWRLMLLDEMGSSVRNLGDVRWLSIEDGLPGKGTGEHIACFVLAGPSDEGLDVRRLAAVVRDVIYGLRNQPELDRQEIAGVLEREVLVRLVGPSDEAAGVVDDLDAITGPEAAG